MLKNSPNSRVLHELCERHFLLGDLAVFEMAVANSLSYKWPVSLLVIAPSGQFKSSLGNVVTASFPKKFFCADRFSEYGIIKHADRTRINEKTWYINDFVRTLEGMSDYKVASFLSFLAVLMSEGRVDVSNYQFANIKLDCRMNLVGNIAYVKYFEVMKMIKTSTFYDRVFEFWYKLDRKQVREKTEKLEKVSRLGKYPIRLSPSCKLPVSLKAEVYRLSDGLVEYGIAEENMRGDNLVEGWLAGHAMFNGRKEITADDVLVFDYMMAKKHFSKVL